MMRRPGGSRFLLARRSNAKAANSTHLLAEGAVVWLLISQASKPSAPAPANSTDIVDAFQSALRSLELGN